MLCNYLTIQSLNFKNLLCIYFKNKYKAVLYAVFFFLWIEWATFFILFVANKLSILFLVNRLLRFSNCCVWGGSDVSVQLVFISDFFQDSHFQGTFLKELRQLLMSSFPLDVTETVKRKKDGQIVRSSSGLQVDLIACCQRIFFLFTVIAFQ